MSTWHQNNHLVACDFGTALGGSFGCGGVLFGGSKGLIRTGFLVFVGVFGEPEKYLHVRPCSWRETRSQTAICKGQRTERVKGLIPTLFLDFLVFLAFLARQEKERHM